MSGMYSVVMEDTVCTVVAAGCTPLSFVAAADAALCLHSVRIGQYSDAGDDLAGMVSVKIQKYTGSAPTGGGAFTPLKLNNTLAAAGFTAREGDVTADPGTAVTYYAEAFNVQAGWLYLPTPEERFTFVASEKWAIIMGTPGSDITVNATAILEELG